MARVSDLLSGNEGNREKRKQTVVIANQQFHQSGPRTGKEGEN
jgi:hypothetical protein